MFQFLPMHSKANEIVQIQRLMKKSSGSNILFDAGSSMDWIIVKDRIINAYRAANCWDLVEIPNGMSFEEPTPPGKIPYEEIEFEMVEPDEDTIVNDEVDRRIGLTRQLHFEKIASIHRPNSPDNNLQKQMELH